MPCTNNLENQTHTCSDMHGNGVTEFLGKRISCTYIKYIKCFGLCYEQRADNIVVRNCITFSLECFSKCPGLDQKLL